MRSNLFRLSAEQCLRCASARSRSIMVAASTASPSVAALGLFFYQTFMVLGRAVNDRLVRRFDDQREPGERFAQWVLRAAEGDLK